MKNLWGVLVAIIALCSPAVADEAARIAAQELVNFTIAKSIHETIDKVSSAAWTNLQASLPKNIDEATMTDLRKEFERTSRKYTSEVIKVAPDIYARHFTADELNGVIAFYKTPLGNKVLSEMPNVMADFTNSTLMPLMASMKSELKSNLEAVVRKHELLKKARETAL